MSPFSQPWLSICGLNVSMLNLGNFLTHFRLLPLTSPPQFLPLPVQCALKKLKNRSKICLEKSSRCKERMFQSQTVMTSAISTSRLPSNGAGESWPCPPSPYDFFFFKTLGLKLEHPRSRWLFRGLLQRHGDIILILMI